MKQRRTGEDDAFEALVPVRPYSRESAAAEEEQRRQRIRPFRPRMPTENRPVERVQFASASSSATAEGMLKDAYRRQEKEDTKTHQAFIPQREKGVSLPTHARQGDGDHAMPRRPKERRAGRSMELMDLAFSGSTAKAGPDGKLKSNYAPISVPYYDVKQEVQDQEASAASTAPTSAGKSRPKMVQVDEMNANAAKQLFLDKQGQLLENQIFFIQLPAVLPELADPGEEVRREGDEDATQSLSKLPDGVVGKLRIHKSGRVRLDIGGIPFCVDQGCDTYFQQDLVCVCPHEREVVSLGKITRRMVVTPDVDAMLSTVAASGDAAQAGENPAAAHP